MEFGTVPPLPPTHTVDTARQREGTPGPAANTDLATEKTVTGAASVQKAEPQDSSGRQRAVSAPQPKADGIRRENLRDEITNSFVFRKIDNETGTVIEQIPQESVLRLRQVLQNAGAASDAGSGVGSGEAINRQL